MKIEKILMAFVVFGVLGFTSENAKYCFGSDDKEKVQSETSPIADKDIGIEVNPIYLIMSKKDNILLTGTISLFNISRKAELAIPLSYYKTTDEEDNELKSQQVIIDFQYRRFLKGIQKGFYFSGGLRYSYNYGYDCDMWWDEDIVKNYARHKVGLSFGIGYRYFSPSGLYWGFSIYGGRYFTGTDVTFLNTQTLTVSRDIFWDIELLKFGYAF